MMNSAPVRVLMTALICFGCFATAEAAQGSRRSAQEMVRQAEAQQGRLLAQAPRLGEIDAAIRADCAAKNKAASRDSAFCGCAAAVTMMLWRSGADPQMAPRLLDFANRRGDATAQSFLTYQGPALYQPICSLAGRK
jgi:hypothetical protein